MLSVQFQEHIWREIKQLNKSDNNLGCQLMWMIYPIENPSDTVYTALGGFFLHVHIENNIVTELFY